MPVYISNEDYHGKSAVVPKDEFKAWQRIYLDALNEKRSAGSVCVYLVNPDSTGIAGGQGDALWMFDLKDVVAPICEKSKYHSYIGVRTCSHDYDFNFVKALEKAARYKK